MWLVTPSLCKRSLNIFHFQHHLNPPFCYLPLSFFLLLHPSFIMTAQHDLTMRMIPFLDRHLVYPLIKFVDLNEVSCSITFLSATPEPRPITHSSSFITCFLFCRLTLPKTWKRHCTSSLETRTWWILLWNSTKRLTALKKYQKVRPYHNDCDLSTNMLPFLLTHRIHGKEGKSPGQT